MLESTPSAKASVGKKAFEMCDLDIRLTLRKRLALEYQHDRSTLVIEELGLCEGMARVDIAVINGHIEGYEIKSDRDTLYRLPGQLEVYGKTLNKVTVIAGAHHINKITELVPQWWGIEEVSSGEGEISFKLIRRPSLNPSIDPYSVVQLLWRDEALEVLKDLGLSRGMLTKPRTAIWSKLAESLPVEELCAIIRSRLSSRENWR
jgi:hypothetical protein